MALARANAATDGRRIRGERGQTLVEFAIAAPLLVLLIAGIIQFGVALNYWLDMQRIANQGARWAVVNAYPTCGQGVSPPCPTSLQTYLASEPVSGGLNPNVRICFDGGQVVGDPITVRLTTPFSFVPIVGVGTLNLTAQATMRIEQPPTKITEDASCP